MNHHRCEWCTASYDRAPDRLDKLAAAIKSAHAYSVTVFWNGTMKLKCSGTDESDTYGSSRAIMKALELLKQTPEQKQADPKQAAKDAEYVKSLRNYPDLSPIGDRLEELTKKKTT